MKNSNIENYNKDNEVNIDSAIILASLDKDNLKKLSDFIFDYNLYCVCSERRMIMNRGKKITYEDFIDFCKSRFVDNENMMLDVFGNKLYYRSLFRNYKGLIQEIIKFSSEELKNFFDTFDNNVGIMSFCQLREYLFNNYEYKEDNLKKLKALKKLGIRGLVFDENAKIDGDYTMVVLENRVMQKKGKNLYGVKGYATDGDITWRVQMDSDGYDFSLDKANYIIKYVKGTAFLDDVCMVACNLNFDIESLPNKEELFDFSVLPNIDFDLIRKKTRAVNLVYTQECCLEYAKKLLKYNKELRDNLENGGFNNEALEMSKQLIFLESFINTCEKLGNDMGQGKYVDPLIEKIELNNFVAKRRSRDFRN